MKKKKKIMTQKCLMKEKVIGSHLIGEVEHGKIIEEALLLSVQKR